MNSHDFKEPMLVIAGGNKLWREFECTFIAVKRHLNLFHSKSKILHSAHRFFDGVAICWIQNLWLLKHRPQPAITSNKSFSGANWIYGRVQKPSDSKIFKFGCNIELSDFEIMLALSIT